MKTSIFTITGKSLIILFFLLIFGCGNRSDKKFDETPTRGNVKIAVDESYQLLIDTEIYTFHSIYKYAQINVDYTTETKAFDLFFKDSIRLMIVNRKLTDDQEQNLKKAQIIPRTTKIAYDALALIVNNDNPDTLIRYDQLKDIFTGNLSKWKSINSKSTLGNLAVVFDNNESGNPRYIREKFSVKGKFPSYCYAVKSNEEVINFVKNNKNALGIISVNWISDPHDTISHRFLNELHIVSVGQEGDINGTGEFRKPYQGYIAEGSYPFIREVYAISRETFAGLGSGFISFFAGDKGQRIVLKSGLVPATMPIRLIEIKKNK